MQILKFKPGVTTSKDVDKFVADKNHDDLRYGKKGTEHFLYVSPGKKGGAAFEKMEISLNAVGKRAVERFRNVIMNELLQEIEGHGNVRSPGKVEAAPRQLHLAQFRALKDVLLKKHLEKESLFRIDGDRQEVASVHETGSKVFRVEEAKLNDLSALALATLLKRMVNAFPGGLLGDKAGQTRIKQLLRDIGPLPPGAAKQARLAELGKALAGLPEENRQFFSECCMLMHAVAAHSDRNLMPLENLVAVFQPNLFPDVDASPGDMKTSARESSEAKLNAQQWGLVDYLNTLVS